MSHIAHVKRALEQERERNAQGRTTSGGFYGPITGKVYDSAEARDYYELREAQKRAKPSPAQEAFSKLSAEEIKQLAMEDAKTNQEKQDAIACNVDIQIFLAAHPEFDDDPDPTKNANGTLIKSYWKSRGVRYPTLTQIEESFEVLKADGLIKLRPDVLQEQAREKANQRAREVQARRTLPSEDELAGMSLEEIRRRATLAQADEDGYTGF